MAAKALRARRDSNNREESFQDTMVDATETIEMEVTNSLACGSEWVFRTWLLEVTSGRSFSLGSRGTELIPEDQAKRGVARSGRTRPISRKRPKVRMRRDDTASARRKDETKGPSTVRHRHSHDYPNVCLLALSNTVYSLPRHRRCPLETVHSIAAACIGW